MSSAILSQLKSLVEKTEQLKDKSNKLYQSDDQWQKLTDLSLRLSNAASQLQQEIKSSKESRATRAWKESEKHRTQAQLVKGGDIFAKGRLRQPAIFRRNIVVIYEGPKISTFDSEDARFRKESTQKRCDVIRSLSPDGVISWAIAYAPTLWAGGAIASDVFNCLIDDIEPDVVQTWPLVIRETLHKLKEEETHLQNHQYIGKRLNSDQRSTMRQVERKIHCEQGSADALTPIVWQFNGLLNLRKNKRPIMKYLNPQLRYQHTDVS
ncbi:hypothetical protein EMCG_01360 [[Emmonsia] crescens]|uniref:Uncharacterized protein n=1 Tax=[Emmonsia] crescens TaxID=73230 RepID=A0A0G2I247_9EURO|nr:hypothetical protein EMCG_01360 [Emmonsia crescens UAMH 3008]